MSAAEELKAIEAEVAACTACKLHLSRKLVVPGAGSPQADIVFIGEAPGFHENEQGVPLSAQQAGSWTISSPVSNFNVRMFSSAMW